MDSGSCHRNEIDAKVEVKGEGGESSTTKGG